MEIIQKFQDLLKKLFHFETSDLDFGIYRILNFKRDQIEKFIQEDLKDKVEFAFAKRKDEKLTNINQRFEEAKQKVIQSLGTQAFTPTGELKKEFKDTPLGRDFLSIKAQKDEAETIDEIKLQVFNDLYNFFSRYYEEGDFVPQYRHSIKGHKYAIPYNGEEVKLYWANNEQYYTKTGLLFRDYTFKANDYKVIFRIVSAREELGSKKATKARFFILDDENPYETEDKALIIRFQYRELTEEEVKSYDVEGGSNTAKQEKINQKSYENILGRIEDTALKALLGKDYKGEKPLLIYQISRFTAKNTKDYFIHKNLKKFLSEQLDYFIKAEVLDIETLEKERFLDKHITRAKVVREIGEDIIDFLSQIEDFQKRLWEKKKFVLKTEYVITTDRLPEEFYGEIWKNEEQKNEWRDLGFEIPKTKQELKNKKLPIDTKYFSEEFKERLLEKLTQDADLDDLLDGLLIKSENWQALNSIKNRWCEGINLIYIDPPFNTENEQFLYKDNYKDSSWITLMNNRLDLADGLLNQQGSIYLHIDENADHFARLLMDRRFIYKRGIIWNTSPLNIAGFKTKADNWIYATGTILFYIKSNRYTFNTPHYEIPDVIKGYFKYDGEDESGKYRMSRYGQKIYISEEKGDVIPNVWNDILSFNYAAIAADESFKFFTQKPERLLKRIIETSSNIGDLILDFFLGLGTTVAVAHKLRRKWIGIEMGDYFEEFYFDYDREKKEMLTKTGVLGRMKEVLAGYGNHEPCGISKEVNWQGGGFFKYQILEQYEDTLDNIEPKENKQAQLKFGDDYLLKYFLDYETRGNPSLLNIEHLKNPFSYKLKVNLEEVGEPQEMVVDIPETFNYLLGLKVRKIKARNNGRKYLFVLGEGGGKDVAIVWREYDDNWSKGDLKEDKEFIIKELEPWAPHIVYVNGQSILTPKNWEVRYIEPEFKRLMEA